MPIQIKIDNSNIGTVCGILGGAGALIGTVYAIVRSAKRERQEREKLEAYKSEHYNNVGISNSITNASVGNSLLEDVNDRVHAKVLLEEKRATMMLARTANEFAKQLSELNSMLSAFGDGYPTACMATVRYYWDLREEGIRQRQYAADTARAERMHRDELYYGQQKLDSIASAVTRRVQAIAEAKTKSESKGDDD